MFFDGWDPPAILSLADGTPVRFRRHSGRAGPAVMLLHGHPQTHAMWHAVAPPLADAGFEVICPDLPGYGGTAPDARIDPVRGTASGMAATWRR